MQRSGHVILIGALAAIGVLAAVGCVAGPAAEASPTSGGGGGPLIAATLPLAGGARTAELVGAQASGQQIGVWVSGSGTVEGTPALAIVVLGVEAQEGTVTLARQRAGEGMTAVMRVLRSQRVEERDIRTTRFTIQPVWNYEKGQPVLVGYRVANTVEVRVRELASLGAVIDDAAGAAGDVVRVQSIGFTIENATVLQDRAREAALRDARAKAEQMARLSGVTLGAPVFISESSPFARPAPVASEARVLGAADSVFAATPISAGELTISVTVAVVYEIR